jgi:YbbR domain-containing protein
VRSPRDVIVHNWPLKLAAVVLSVLLWVLVSAEETTSQLIRVPVEIEVPPGLALAKPIPEVRALITGSGREMIKLYATPPVIRAFVPAGAQPPRWRFDATPAAIQLPANAKVTVQDVEPRVVDIALDRFVSRDVPVALRAVIEPESGYTITGHTLAPTHVRVGGARALVLGLDSFPTELIEARGVTERFERSVPLDTTGRSLLTVTPREVTLTGSARRRGP